jgi:hypothetical protein
LRTLNAIMRSFKKLFYDENRHGISGYQFVTCFSKVCEKKEVKLVHYRSAASNV